MFPSSSRLCTCVCANVVFPLLSPSNFRTWLFSFIKLFMKIIFNNHKISCSWKNSTWTFSLCRIFIYLWFCFEVFSLMVAGQNVPTHCFLLIFLLQVSWLILVCRSFINRVWVSIFFVSLLVNHLSDNYKAKIYNQDYYIYIYAYVCIYITYILHCFLLISALAIYFNAHVFWIFGWHRLCWWW